MHTTTMVHVHPKDMIDVSDDYNGNGNTTTVLEIRSWRGNDLYLFLRGDTLDRVHAALTKHLDMRDKKLLEKEAADVPVQA